jgi:hypothetical protein
MLRLLVIVLALAVFAPPHAEAQQRSRTYDCNGDGDIDSLETVCEINLFGFESITLCGTVGTAPFSDFDIALSNDGTTFVTFYTTSGDYTSPAGYLHSVWADPTAWSTTPNCLRLDALSGIQSVRFLAAGTSSVPSFKATVQ